MIFSAFITPKYQKFIEIFKTKTCKGCGDLDIYQAFKIPKLKFD